MATSDSNSTASTPSWTESRFPSIAGITARASPSRRCAAPEENSSPEEREHDHPREGRRPVVNREAENPGEYDSGRSTVVTGVGFCLPGRTKPVFTAEEAWDVAANGQSCLEYDEVYYGSVKLTREMFDEHFPDLPPFFSRHYTSAHRYGLVSL